jgi:hypothetical protein
MRMIHGIYTTRFTSNGQDFGSGIVVLDGMSLHGGDADYLYKGHNWLQDHHCLEATVQVQNYTDRLNALVGPLSSFELTFTGRTDSQTMRLSGSVNGSDDRTIQVTLTKISDLVDPSRGCFEAACAVVATTVVEAPTMVTRRFPPLTDLLESAEVRRSPRKPRNR